MFGKHSETLAENAVETPIKILIIQYSTQGLNDVQ